VIRTFAAALVVFLASAASAQEVPGAEGPTSGPPLGDGPHAIGTTTAFAAKRIVAPAKTVFLPPLDVQPLLDEDAQIAADPSSKADPRVAVLRAFLPVAAPHWLDAGARGVETLPDGSLVWSAEFGSAGAFGLRVHVADFALPPGATLVAYDAADPSQAYGPFEGRGPNGSGAFWLPTVFGETERVEIRVPARSAGRWLTFRADRLAQRYRERAEGMADPRIGGTTKAGTCNNNVACDASYVADVARAVATMEIVETSGVYLCTGALLNDSNVSTNVPYFLTAHHCLSTETDANNTEFYFDYRAATCDGFPPPLSTVPRVSGATLLATSSSSDFTLLKLTGTMPSNRFFCGWTATLQTSGEAVVGVHHPGGNQMRISYGTLLGPDGNFHQVQWSSGVTAPGSSGSPLFNPSKQVIGQLYGGASSCTDPSGIDEYGRFDRTYPWISQWLGTGSDTPAMDSYDPGDDTPAGATPLDVSFAEGKHGPHSLSKTDTADWFAFDFVAGVRYRIFSTGQDDVDATLYSGAAATTVVASDKDSGGSGQFSIDYTPTASGVYKLKVTTAVAGDSAEYTLNYTEVDTKATKVPPAVGELRKHVTSGNVTLRWRDRSRIETGYYVEMSNDGGVTWARVGELPRDAHAFLHVPGPGVHLYRVGAWNATDVIRWRQISVTIIDPNMLDVADPADDTSAGATLLTPSSGGTVAGRSLSQSDLEDWYAIDMTQGRTYVIETTGGSADTSGTLYDDASGLFPVASNDDSGVGRNFRIVTTATRTGRFWLLVRPYVDGAVFTYSLKWTER
jgi:hypothetical protein